jgi:hypothetical protein
MGNTGSYNFIDTDLDHQNNRCLDYKKRMTKAKCS